MARICYLSRNYRNTTASGNKAKTDNELSLGELGAVNIGLKTTYSPSKITTFVRDLAGVIKLSLTVRRGDIVVLQYPVKKYFSFVCRACHRRGARVVALIHDLGSMRRKKLTAGQEIGRLMHADYVIASNATMRRWLTDHGYANPLGQLQLFDYRSQSVPSPRDIPPLGHLPQLVYAGALARRKNTFLLQMEQEARAYRVVVYGNRDGLPGLTDSEHVAVRGFMDSEAFVQGVEGDYGLVWDGDSLDQCTGNFGEYLRWNSPHKASFYLRAGLPLVVWSRSALAPIVREEGIGLVVDSLSQLNDILPAITPEQHRQMLRQVGRVGQRLSRGQYLKEALAQAVKTLESQG